LIPDLLRHGADVNAVDERDEGTALHSIMKHSGTVFRDIVIDNVLNGEVPLVRFVKRP
jgi:hypothetical protein